MKKSQTENQAKNWKRLEVLTPVELLAGQKRKKKYKIKPEDIERFTL
ncbi:TPA: hypothetical protein ACJXXT_000238 [Pseudomonas aeruginosa]